MDARKRTILEVVILFIIIIGLCTVWALNSFGVINLCKGNTTVNPGCNCPKCSDSKECDCPKCEEKKCDCINSVDTSNSKSLTIDDGETSGGKKYSVEWVNGDVIVKLGSDSKVITSNIDEYYDFHYGVSDICEGNRVLIFVSNKKIVSSLSVDQLSCGDNIKVKNDFSKVGTFSSLVQKSKYYNENQPLTYSIYAVNADTGSELDITNYFND